MSHDVEDVGRAPSVIRVHGDAPRLRACRAAIRTASDAVDVTATRLRPVRREIRNRPRTSGGQFGSVVA